MMLRNTVIITAAMLLVATVLYPMYAPRREISATPGKVGVFQHTDAGQLYVKAQKAWKQKRYAEAEQLYRQSIKINDTPMAREDLARLLAETRKGREALDYYRQIVHPDLNKSGSTAREQPDVLLKYAQLCDKFGEKEEAEEAYRKIIGLHKTYRNLPSFSDGETNPKRLRAQALTVTGVYYTQKARDFNDQEARKDALAAFDEAIRLEPNGSAATYRQKVLTQKPKAAQ